MTGYQRRALIRTGVFFGLLLIGSLIDGLGAYLGFWKANIDIENLVLAFALAWCWAP
jgi:hypothetical protein